MQKKLWSKCKKCKGKGFLTGTALFGEKQSYPCPKCKGTGYC